MESIENIMFLDKLISLQKNGQQMSITKILLIFYLIIGNNYTKHLFSGQLNEFITNNRLVQHLIGYITIFVLITEIIGMSEIDMILYYTTLIYLWFLFSTKLDITWSIVIFVLLLLGYLYENRLIIREKEVQEDLVIDHDKKKAIMSDNMKKRLTIILPILLITILGTFLYGNKKLLQYGSSFDLEKFLINDRKR